MHHLQNKLIAGAAGFAIAFVAETTSGFIENKILPEWSKTPILLFPLRSIIYIGFGTLAGSAASFIAPTLAITATTGVAIGVAAFIGSLLGRLILKIVRLVFPSTETANDKSEIEIKIYGWMGLNKAADFAPQKDEKFYSKNIRKAVREDIKTSVNVDDEEKIADRLVKSVNALAKILREDPKNKEYLDDNLTERMSKQIKSAVVANDVNKIKVIEYSKNMKDPFDFDTGGKVTLEKKDVQFINKVFRKVQVFLKN